MSERYIGLMSGTSMDGIDAALVEFTGNHIQLVASHSHPIPDTLKSNLFLLSQNASDASIDMLGEADAELGELFAEATTTLLAQSQTRPEQVTAIGSHGQTIRHRPDLPHRFTLQIADPSRISYLTGITTVADFRRKDMAAGGEGAPLAPAFHQQVFFSDSENRAVLNIGGIANLTALSADPEQPCFGFDTGPGNGLMDAWIDKHRNLTFDRNGEWAASAPPDDALVQHLMSDSYLQLTPPKSTGKEHYNLAWLESKLTNFNHLSPAEIHSSLCEFTSQSIAESLLRFIPETSRLIVCGGGVHNQHLLSRLQTHLPDLKIDSSEQHGVHPDWVEAIAFAWLARQTLNNRPGNLAAVTGASKHVILGGIYPAG